MSINIGPLLSLYGAGDCDKFGYAVTYNLCGAGLIVALLVYFACRGMVKNIDSEQIINRYVLQFAAGVLLGTVVMIFLCAADAQRGCQSGAHGTSIVVTIFFFREAFDLDKTSPQ